MPISFVNDSAGRPISEPAAPKPAAPGMDWQALFSNQTSNAPDVASQDPYKDAAYNAWYRGSGMNAAQIQANKSRQQAGLSAQLEAQKPVWADTLARGLKNIAGNAEANGVFQSGQRLQDQNNFQVDQSRAQQGFENGIQGQIGDLGANAQVQLQDLARQNAEQQLAARQRLAQQSITEGSNPLLMEYLQNMLQGKV